MSFADSIRTVFGKYVDFSGRARRSEYWWFALFSAILGIVVGIIDAAIHTPILQIIVGLALLLPSLAVGVRRLHDTGKSGWLILLGIIPLVGAIILLVFFCQDSQPGQNAHGAAPK
jgi:uncharacterized membrane protein YhaH (DUF805 family)